MADSTPHDYVMCHNCKGNKKVRGLGFMQIDCLRCQGKGWTLREIIREKEVDEALEVLSSKRAYKRREKKPE
jgi:hypothetical protein